MWVQPASLDFAPATVTVTDEEEILLGKKLAQVTEFSQAPAPARVP